MSEAVKGSPPSGAPPPDDPIERLIKNIPILTETVKQENDRLRSIADQKKKLLEVGLLAYLIGDADNAPSRIAFITIIISLIAIVAIPSLFVIAGRSESSPLLDKVLSGLFGLVTLALGYLFGSGALGRKDGATPRSRRNSSKSPS